MKTMTGSTLLALLLIVGLAMPALSQTKDAIMFSNFLCEIDLSVLQLPGFQRSEFTLVSRKVCAGTASARNTKIECEDTIRNWTLGDRSVKNFDCTINGDQCGITAKPGDPNAPLLTTKTTNLTVSSTGKAKLTCFYKPTP
jgi:hypothetical protein